MAVVVHDVFCSVLCPVSGLANEEPETGTRDGIEVGGDGR